MSENSLEDIKKICLICGCHTKQAINIYEPRNGPNIIELIQAKFKFQPANDDKYLCYSCNNWLINWHSLQTLNNSSNNESGNYGHSSKSRSHHIRNESIPEEECNDHHKIRTGNHHRNYNYANNDLDRNHENGDVDKKKDNNDGDGDNDDDRNSSNNLSKQKRMGFYFSRRNCIKWRRIRKVRRKYKQYRSCAFCGRSLKTHLPIRFRGLSKKITIKCKTCSHILEWSSNYSKILLKEENRKLKQLNMKNLNNDNDYQCNNINGDINKMINNNSNNKNLNNDNNNVNNHQNIIKNYQTNLNDLVNNHRYHHLHHQRPLIDGKVVAMLRRLGTTLTRESDCYNIDKKIHQDNNILAQNNNLIWNQQNQQQHQQQNLPFSHTCLNSNSNNNNNMNTLNKREMEDNEILIDFNTAITEVLQPFDLVKYQITSSLPSSLLSSSSSSLNIMELKNKNPDVELIDVENDKNAGQEQQEQQPQLSLEAIYKRIPKCVTISVISSNDGIEVEGGNNVGDDGSNHNHNNHHRNHHHHHHNQISSAIVKN